jgi:hypothetical protein
VSLARHSAAGKLIDRLAHLGSQVIARLRSLANQVEPVPETPLIFGSFARGEADADSDLDVLAVRSPAATLTNGQPRFPALPNRPKLSLAILSSCSTTASRTCAAKRDRKPRRDANSGARFAAMPSCSLVRNSTTL